LKDLESTNKAKEIFNKMNIFSFKSKSFSAFKNFAMLGENESVVEEIEPEIYNLSLIFMNSLITIDKKV
jgi:hypothetical protein